MPYTSALICLVLAVLVSCARPAPEPTADMLANPTDNRSTDPVEIAREVVAKRSGLSAEDLALVSSEFIEFSDSGLGCPVAGRAYLQVITPGYRVVLNTGTQNIDVRVSGTGGRICERPQPE